MKKLLCVLMFGMMFGQDAITTREYTLSISQLSQDSPYMIDIESITGYDLEVANVEIFHINNINLQNNEIFGWLNLESAYTDPFSGEQEWKGQYSRIFGAGYNTVDYRDGSAKFINGNPLRFGWNDGGNGNGIFTADIAILISARFPNEDTGLNGDLNEDENVDILDIVALVNIILDDGVGDIGNLIDAVKG